jgi:hypothetical protein
MSSNGIKKEVNDVKRYYADYVRHCLRFYVMTMDMGTSPRFNTEVDRNNWAACYAATKNFDDKTLDIVREIYGPGDTIPDKIYNLAKGLGVTQDYLWNIVNTLERNVAKRRGLL